MPTLQELMEKFASAEADGATDDASSTTAAQPDGATKLAGGAMSENSTMRSLTDIYLAMDGMDKQAGQAAGVPPQGGASDEELNFAKMAEQLADAEASEQVDGQEEIVKIAQEYDSAGRIMARGFYSEFLKLAGAMDTDVTPNQDAYMPGGHASTPALGERGNPIVENNYAGSKDHQATIETTGPGPKQVYSSSLETSKKIKAGQGTGDDPEAAALSLGSGSPAGFATIKDLQI
jgi:hypothetical protein